MSLCWSLLVSALWLGVLQWNLDWGSGLGVPELPPARLPTDFPGHSLLDSFYKLVGDAEDHRSLSNFSDELAAAVLSVLHNLSSSLVRNKIAAEVDAASRNEMLDNPDLDNCSQRNYSRLCPVGWYELGDGKTCKAASEYTGPCEGTADFSATTPLSKKGFARRCEVSWPCSTSCEEDYSDPCPEGWADEGGVCKAPYHYRGNCVLQKVFTDFDEASKARWYVLRLERRGLNKLGYTKVYIEKACNVRWPCKGYDADFTTSACPIMWTATDDGKACEAPPSYAGPCDPVQRIREASSAEKARTAARCGFQWPANFLAHYDFSESCPLGWTVAELSQQLPECHAPEGYSGSCAPKQRLGGISDEQKYDFMMRCSATWPIRDVAERNYVAPCPSLWHLESKESGICAAPTTYNGPCQSRLSFRNYDADMKKAFEGRCKAYFPTSAYSALPKLQPIIAGSPLSSQASGPIAPSPTKLQGMVVLPNHTIYLPSKGKIYPTKPLAPPKPPGITASLAAATATHIKRLREIEASATDLGLGSVVQDVIQELANQGGAPNK